MTPRMSRRDWIASITVALLALAATVTSIGHDFTFDDRYVILSNERVHSLHALWRLFGQTYWPPELGGDGYRPVVMTLFSLQWVAGSGAPWLFHLGNILLTIATALAVFWCASAVLSRTGAWVSAALFAVHPVHVEVTGNVVGQSELLVALCLCIAIGIYLRARRAGPLRPRTVAAILLLYAVGLFSKEHAIVLPCILLAAEWTVLRGARWGGDARAGRMLALLFVAITVAFLYVRGLVLPDVAGFAPHPVFVYLRMSAFSRIATMMNEIPRIGRLLVFPIRMSADYTPGEVIVSQGPELTQLPGLFICLGVAALAVALRDRARVASFGLFWLIIAFLPVSNLIVAAGFVTAERTLFFPSVGVVLVAGAIVAQIIARRQRVERWTAAAAVCALLTLGIARSISRQRVWKDNETLFAQTVLDEPDGYRAHFMYGRALAGQQKLREMELEFRRAMRLFPYDVSMMLNIGGIYYRAGLCKPANALLQWSFAVEPKAVDGRYAYVRCLAQEGRWDESRTAALEAMRLLKGRELKRLRRALVSADSALGRPRHELPAVPRLPQSATDTANSRSAGVSEGGR